MSVTFEIIQSSVSPYNTHDYEVLNSGYKYFHLAGIFIILHL